MRSIVSPQFRKMLERLPPQVQQEARAGFARWKEDPKSVGFKRLSGMHADVWSTQIGLRYRAIGVVSRENDAIAWMFVGSHEDYNNYISVHRKMSQDAWLSSVQDRVAAPPLKRSKVSTEAFQSHAAPPGSHQPRLLSR
jgi:hypothetical protein